MTTALQFDEYGYLKPYQPILVDLVTFEQVFVKDFLSSKTRPPLFEKYREFNRLICEILPDGYEQWVDGSFVSQKTDPNDIDVLTFVDAKIYEEHEKRFNELRRWRNQIPKSVDGFFVNYYAENHRYQVRFDSDRIEWLNTFSTWKGKDLKTRNKGLIVLKF